MVVTFKIFKQNALPLKLLTKFLCGTLSSLSLYISCLLSLVLDFLSLLLDFNKYIKYFKEYVIQITILLHICNIYIRCKFFNQTIFYLLKFFKAFISTSTEMLTGYISKFHRINWWVIWKITKRKILFKTPSYVPGYRSVQVSAQSPLQTEAKVLREAISFAKEDDVSSCIYLSH